MTHHAKDRPRAAPRRRRGRRPGRPARPGGGRDPRRRTATRWRPRCSGSATAPSGCTWSTSTRPSAGAPTPSLLAAWSPDLDIQVELCGGIRDDASLEAALAHRLRPGQPRHRRARGARSGAPRDRRATATGSPSAWTCGAPRWRRRGWTQDGGELWEVLARLDGRGVRPLRRHRRAPRRHADRPQPRAAGEVCAAPPSPVVASGGVSARRPAGAAPGPVRRRGRDRREGALRGQVHPAPRPWMSRAAADVHPHAPHLRASCTTPSTPPPAPSSAWR